VISAYLLKSHLAAAHQLVQSSTTQLVDVQNKIKEAYALIDTLREEVRCLRVHIDHGFEIRDNRGNKRAEAIDKVLIEQGTRIIALEEKNNGPSDDQHPDGERWSSRRRRPDSLHVEEVPPSEG
jgi:hypothetical protein